MNKKIITISIISFLIISFFVVRDVRLNKKIKLEKEYQAWYEKVTDKYVDCILQGWRGIGGTDLLVNNCFDERTLHSSVEDFAKRDKSYDDETNGK